MSHFPPLRPTVTVTPLKKHRFLRGIKQMDLAKALGHSPSWLSIREAGIVPLSAKDAALVSKILKVSVEDLLAQDGGR